MSIANFIDHTYLKPDCTEQIITNLCDEAINYGFYAVCVPPFFVRHAKSRLVNSNCKVATVIGYPYGYSMIAAKVEEIKRASDDGADELDIVVNITAIKNEDWNYLKNDIESTTRAAQLKGKVAKIILETALLTREEIAKVCKYCLESGVDYVKTSTGLFEGADVHTIRLMKDVLGSKVKIKASGGIRNLKQTHEMIDAGADRIGTSSSVQIVTEKQSTSQ